MPVAQPESLRETVKLMYVQGVRPAIIIAETGVKPGTLKTWASRNGWTKAVRKTQAVMVQRGKDIIDRESTADLADLRKVLRSEAVNQAAVLRSKPVKTVQALANTPAREGRASVLKKLVESVSMIDDWDSAHRPGLVLCEMLGEDRSQGQVVDIQSSCVSDTTTGSVNDRQPTEATPQDSQVADAKPDAV